MRKEDMRLLIWLAFAAMLALLGYLSLIVSFALNFH